MAEHTYQRGQFSHDLVVTFGQDVTQIMHSVLIHIELKHFLILIHHFLHNVIQ
jgi:hypothetical protein